VSIAGCSWTAGEITTDTTAFGTVKEGTEPAVSPCLAVNGTCLKELAKDNEPE
jgi:hypothetical protein